MYWWRSSIGQSPVQDHDQCAGCGSHAVTHIEVNLILMTKIPRELIM